MTDDEIRKLKVITGAGSIEVHEMGAWSDAAMIAFLSSVLLLVEATGAEPDLVIGICWAIVAAAAGATCIDRIRRNRRFQ